MPAQTDIQNSSADPSADDFLAREKAILGDDADNFATADDSAAFQTSEDDLMGGGDLLGGGGDETAQFEQQFPDLSGPNEVRVSWVLTPCRPTMTSRLSVASPPPDDTSYLSPTDYCSRFTPDANFDLLPRLSHPAVPSPVPARP